MSNVAIAYDDYEGIDIGFEKPKIKVRTADLVRDAEGIFQDWLKTPQSHTIPLFTIDSYPVEKPIIVKIYNEGKWVFAENETLAITGTGETQEEAIKDFEAHVLYFYSYYKDIPSSDLTGDAITLKEVFSNLLPSD